MASFKALLVLCAVLVLARYANAQCSADQGERLPQGWVYLDWILRGRGCPAARTALSSLELSVWTQTAEYQYCP